MPFIGNMVLCEPFLRGALQHPNKALFNFDSPKTTMSTRYHGTLLDHLADFMISLSGASVFVIIVVSAVIIANVIVPVAAIALAFVLRRPLILLSHWLVVACCFASVT